MAVKPPVTSAWKTEEDMSASGFREACFSHFGRVRPGCTSHVLTAGGGLGRRRGPGDRGGGTGWTSASPAWTSPPGVADTNPVGGIIARLSSFLGAVKVAAYLPKTRTASRRARARPQPEATAGCSVHFCFINISWAPLLQRLQRKCTLCPCQQPGPPFRAGHGCFHSNQNDRSCRAEAGCQEFVFLKYCLKMKLTEHCRSAGGDAEGRAVRGHSQGAGPSPPRAGSQESVLGGACSSGSAAQTPASACLAKPATRGTPQTGARWPTATRLVRGCLPGPLV